MATRRFHDPEDPALEAFYEELAAADLQPLWTLHDLLVDEPPIAAVPWCWPGRVSLDLVRGSGGLVEVTKGGDRRVVGFANPGLGGAPFATPTLWGAYQFLGPGEHAPNHRHTPGALRFVMEGTGTWTSVDADPVEMRPGDLVLTPSWCWHEHVNAGPEAMIWFDGLDLPLVRALDAVFFERGATHRPRSGDGPSRGEITFRLGSGLVAADDPVDAPSSGGLHSPLVRYAWADTDRALDQLLGRPGRADWARLRYTNPLTGVDVMPTMRCEMLRVTAGASTPSWRTSGSAVVVVFEGSGVAELGAATFAFESGDVLAIPSWTPHRLRAERRCDLFVLSDAPMLEPFGLLRIG